MMSLRALLLCSALAGLTAPIAARAQSDGAPALLVADRVLVSPDEALIAEGNVEVLFEGQTFQAARIIYDQTSDSVTLEGPLRIVSDDGTILTAERAEIDPGLENGILESARLVLDGQLQMAAVQLARAEGRYSVLSKAAVTSCQICGESGTPLWEIRARRIIHDDAEKQIYLDGAQLRVIDLPVAYIPRLRLPDPTLKRAQGFLFPTIRSNTKLGFGIKVPYFIPLGAHRDITLTPYLSPKTTTLEARYRQAFRTGDITFNGALSRDTLKSDETRGYVFGSGRFDLPRDFTLKFDIELATDRPYLKDYGYSGKSRLDSAIGITRVARDRLTAAELTHFNTLDDDESNATQPSFVLDAEHRQRLFPRMGGEIRLGAALHGHFRYSDDDVVGRDVARTHASALWREDWISAGGLKFALEGGLDIDAVRNADDSTVASEDMIVAPSLLANLRYPLVGVGAGGGRFSLEPVMQVGWVGGEPFDTANDESQRSDFDEGNLLSLSRFAARDRRERGWQAAAGLRFAGVSPSGWRAGLSMGRVIRQEKRSDFSTTSGLSEDTSDWLLAGRLGNDTGLDFIGRALVDDDADVHRAEARGLWSNKRLDLSAGYLMLPEDGAEDRDDLVSEWSFDGSYRVSRHWTASANWQYNLAQDRSSAGGIGLEYQNECVVAQFGLERDFADSDDLDPTTTFEVTVSLKGFSTGGSAGGYRRQCSN